MEAKSPKEIIMSRLDKVVSRESLGAIGTILALVESNAPPKWVALVGCVLIAGLSLEKVSKAVFQGWAAYKSIKAPAADKVEVVDTQDSESSAPNFG